MPLLPEQSHQNLKQTYGKLYETFTQLLAEYDPMWLIESGAPHNEYEPEVKAILPRLQDAYSPSELGHMLYKIFEKYFGAAFGPSDVEPSESVKASFEAIGKKAWEVWKQWERETEGQRE